MALSPARSRVFVIFLLAVMIGLAVLATVMITNGMNDEGLQELVRQDEEAEG